MVTTRSKSREPSLEPESSQRPTKATKAAKATKNTKPRKAPASKQQRASKKAAHRRAASTASPKKPIPTITEEAEDPDSPAKQLIEEQKEQEEHEEQELVLESTETAHSEVVVESRADYSDESGSMTRLRLVFPATAFHDEIVITDVAYIDELRRKVLMDGYGKSSTHTPQLEIHPEDVDDNLDQHREIVDAPGSTTSSQVHETLESQGNDDEHDDMERLITDEVVEVAASNNTEEVEMEEPTTPTPAIPATPTSRSLWSKVGSALVGVASSPFKFIGFGGRNTPNKSAAAAVATDGNETENVGLDSDDSPNDVPQFTFEHEHQISTPSPLSNTPLSRKPRTSLYKTPTKSSARNSRSMTAPRRSADAAIIDEDDKPQRIPQLTFEPIHQLSHISTPHITQAAESSNSKMSKKTSSEAEHVHTPATFRRPPRHRPYLTEPKPLKSAMKSPKKSVTFALSEEVKAAQKAMEQQVALAAAIEAGQKRQASTDDEGEKEIERSRKRQMTGIGTYRVPSPESDEEGRNGDVSMSEEQWDPSPSKTFSCNFSDDSDSDEDEEDDLPPPPATPKPSHVELPASVRKYQPSIPSKLRQVTEMSPLEREKEKENAAPTSPRKMGPCEQALFDYIDSKVEENRTWYIDWAEVEEQDYMETLKEMQDLAAHQAQVMEEEEEL